MTIEVEGFIFIFDEWMPINGGEAYICYCHCYWQGVEITSCPCVISKHELSNQSLVNEVYKNAIQACLFFAKEKLYGK